jgi:hypothetical protein
VLHTISMPRIVRVLLSVLLALNLLVPANVLQTLGWVGMLADRLVRGDMALAAAVEETFDGEHPCALCKAAQTERERETPAAPTKSTEKKAPEKFLLCDAAPPALRRAPPVIPPAPGTGLPAGRDADPPRPRPPIFDA